MLWGDIWGLSSRRRGGGGLWALGRRLDHTRALVVLGGDTGDGVGLLLLWEVAVNIVGMGLGGAGNAYNEQLVGGLLPLLVHGVRSRLGKEADNAKEGEGDGDAGHGAPENLGVGARRVNGTGAVRTECDPVGY